MYRQSFIRSSRVSSPSIVLIVLLFLLSIGIAVKSPTASAAGFFKSERAAVAAPTPPAGGNNNNSDGSDDEEDVVDEWRFEAVNGGGRFVRGDEVITFTNQQLQKKFKHAVDFGIDADYSNASRDAWRDRLLQHLNAETLVVYRNGKYQHLKDLPVIIYYDPATHLFLMTFANGEFISGWLLKGGALDTFLESEDPKFIR